MKMFMILSAIVVCVTARPEYRNLIPNTPALNNIAVGHTDPAGSSPLNAFGMDFSANDRDWTAVCKLDSDKDGVSNGAELGDPCCLWKSQDDNDMLISEGLSHPGVESDTTSNAKLLEPVCEAVAPIVDEQESSEDETPEEKPKDDSSANVQTLSALLLLLVCVALQF